MQMKEAADLRERYGDKPCDHPKLVKEYHFSAATGDYVCTKCGACGWGKNWVEEDRKNSN